MIYENQCNQKQLQDWMDNIEEKATDHMEWHNTHNEHGFDFDL